MADTSFGRAFRRALRKLHGKERVVVLAGHKDRHRGWPDGKPRGLMWHWTAGAATDSVDPDHPGNQKGANAGVVAWCHHPSSSLPWCNITVDRDGTIYINTVSGSAWHSGLGSFRGTKWARLGIGDNRAHEYTIGVEVVDRGLRDDTFTDAQWEAIDAINVAFRQVCGWRGWGRIMSHREWAPTRKVDVTTRYPLEFIYNRARNAWKKLNK